MFKGLDLFKTASALADHAGRRQAIVARNIANADTPGYRARDLQDFADTLGDDSGFSLRATRAGHRSETISGGIPGQRVVDEPGNVSPNGNAVSLEREMVRGADIRQQHDMAISVYRSGIDLLRAGLGRIK